jgi:mannose-1-phosphate guanylyltransferase
MKAVILVGGKATRLMPLTTSIPKSMVPVVNVPFIEHVIRHLNQHGIKEIVLAQGHLANSIEQYVGDGSQFGVRIYYSTEPMPLGSAGAAKFAEKYLDGTFLVMNADIFSDLDFTAMLKLHDKKKAKVTIATTPVDDPSRYGVVESDSDGKVSRFLEKPKREEATTNMINAGAWFVDPSVLQMVPPGVSVSFEREVFPKLLSQGEPFYAFSLKGYWIDMGTPETYLQLHADLLAGKCAHYKPPEGNKLVGEGSSVDPSAQVKGPVVLGKGCHIGAHARLVGPVVVEARATVDFEASIEDSVLWRNVYVGKGSKVIGSILANNCRLESGCLVEGAVIGDNATIAPGARVPRGTKIDPGSTFPAA